MGLSAEIFFNPDTNKRAAEVYFSQKHRQTIPLPIIFNNNNVVSSTCQKHFDLVLNSRVR